MVLWPLGDFSIGALWAPPRPGRPGRRWADAQMKTLPAYGWEAESPRSAATAPS